MTYSVWERVSASRMHVMTTYLRHGTKHKKQRGGGRMYTQLMAGEGGGSVVKVRWWSGKRGIGVCGIGRERQKDKEGARDGACVACV